jgi:hypothetical protein
LAQGHRMGPPILFFTIWPWFEAFALAVSNDRTVPIAHYLLHCLKAWPLGVLAIFLHPICASQLRFSPAKISRPERLQACLVSLVHLHKRPKN